VESSDTKLIVEAESPDGNARAQSRFVLAVLWFLAIVPAPFTVLFMPLYHGDHAHQMLFGVLALGAYCSYRLRGALSNVVARGVLLTLVIIYAIPVLFVVIFVLPTRILGFFTGSFVITYSKPKRPIEANLRQLASRAYSVAHGRRQADKPAEIVG